MLYSVLCWFCERMMFVVCCCDITFCCLYTWQDSKWWIVSGSPTSINPSPLHPGFLWIKYNIGAVSKLNIVENVSFEEKIKKKCKSKNKKRKKSNQIDNIVCQLNLMCNFFKYVLEIVIRINITYHPCLWIEMLNMLNTHVQVLISWLCLMIALWCQLRFNKILLTGRYNL